jgi:tRNA G26 N,N-dimethylase Trm1
MAAIYLFNESLSTQQICAMHRLGPGYKVNLHNSKFTQKIIEIKLENSLCLSVYLFKVAISV